MDSKTVSLVVMKAAVVLFFLHKLLPIVGANMPMPVYLAIFLLVMLTVMYTMLTSKYSGVAIAALLIFMPSVFQTVYIASAQGLTAATKYLYGEAQTYLYIVIAAMYICVCEMKNCRKLILLILLSYFITGATSAIACTLVPNIVRILTANTSEAIYAQYRKLNVGEFSFAYEFILLMPLLICAIKYRRINRLLGIGLLIFMGVVVLQMQFTLGVILYVVMLFVLLLPKLSTRKVTLIFIIVLAVFIFGGEYIAAAFDHIAGIAKNSELARPFASRFEYIAEVFRGGEISTELENTAGTRYDRYLASLQAFLDNPLWGHWGNGANGGHSYILDSAAMYGLLGVFSIAIMYYMIYKLFLKPFCMSQCYPYMMIGYVLSIVMATINTKTFLIILACIYPLFAHVYSWSEAWRYRKFLH